MSSDWNDLLRDYFKVDLDTDEITRWYNEINKELHVGLTELENVIRFAANNQRKDKFAGKPDLRDVLIWVKWYRKDRREQRDGTLDAKTQDGFIAMLKSRILNAHTHMERWNILCDPQIYCGAARTTTVEECVILEDFCKEKYQDYKRPTIDDLITEFGRVHGADNNETECVEVIEEPEDLPF